MWIPFLSERNSKVRRGKTDRFDCIKISNYCMYTHTHTTPKGIYK